MSRNRLRSLAVLALVAAACNDEVDVFEPPAGEGALLESYVALGNSLTAGYQSSGISNTTQQQSYAYLIAQQAGTRYNYARLRGVGCPPPIINFLTGEGEGGIPAAQRAGICQFRDPTTTTGPLNNVAVPGARIVDPTSQFSASSNLLTQFILGGRTQAQRAIEADPTFITAWIGNNDVLEAALGGLPALATPVNNFTASYTAMVQSLRSGAPRLRGGILLGVVNSSNVPALFPADSLFDNPTFQAEFRAATGGDPANPATLTVLANCNDSPSLLSMQIVPAIRAYRANPSAPGAHPPLISCGVTAAAPAPVGDVYILDQTEQTTLAGLVTSYNNVIASQAQANGFVYVDPNPLLAGARTAGLIPARPTLTSATQPFGPLFSLDGFHPSGAGHEIIANAVIDAINDAYGENIPAVP